MNAQLAHSLLENKVNDDYPLYVYILKHIVRDCIENEKRYFQIKCHGTDTLIVLGYDNDYTSFNYSTFLTVCACLGYTVQENTVPRRTKRMHHTISF